MTLKDDADELRIQTQRFKDSEYGKYVMDTLTEMYEGKLAQSMNIECEAPVRMIDRAAQVKEVIEFINQPLD